MRLTLLDIVLQRLARLTGMSAGQIPLDMALADLGLDSAALLGLITEMQLAVGFPIEPSEVFSHPTPRALAEYLEGRVGNKANSNATVVVPYTQADQSKDLEARTIAVVGMGCRFPGGKNPDEYWSLLREGRHGITQVPLERWQVADYIESAPGSHGKAYCRHGGFVDDCRDFDAGRFGLTVRETQMLAPSHRLLLEVAWEALESAGTPGPLLSGARVGVFVGAMRRSESPPGTGGNVSARVKSDPYYGTGTALSAAAGRLAHIWNFRGPCLTVDTACSSSLVAVHLAIQSLRQQECDLALVAGVNTLSSPDWFITASAMGMLAHGSCCRAFDEAADGFLLGEGCGVVVLKRLADARSDRDTVLVTLRGSAINHNGRTNGLIAPNPAAQVELLAAALADARVEPGLLQYVEAHGTGTPLGDAAELAALAAVFGTHPPRKPLFVGSVKPNIGHLAGAAGVAGLIKTVLAVRSGLIPPNLHITSPNPHIDWAAKRVRVPTEVTPWPATAGKRLAGVSSFGWSGTNAHVIVEGVAPEHAIARAPSWQLGLISAGSPEGLAKACTRLATYFASPECPPLHDCCFTQHTGRVHQNHRAIVVGRTNTEMATALTSRDPNLLRCGHAPKPNRLACFIFPDLSPDSGMEIASRLGAHPVVQDTINQCAAALETVFPDEAKWFLAPVSSPCPPVDDQMALPRRHVAAFVAQFALVQFLRAHGISAACALGQGLGEVTAACAAEALTLGEALWLCVRRAQLISLPRTVSAQDLSALVGDIRPRKLSLCVASAALGHWLTSEDLQAPSYWMAACNGKDQFEAAREMVRREYDPAFISVGMPLDNEPLPETAVMLRTLGELWIQGVPVNWARFHEGAIRRRVPVPLSEWERSRYEVLDPMADHPFVQQDSSVQESVRLGITDWFYYLSWQRLPSISVRPAQPAKERDWLLFAREEGSGAELESQIRAQGIRLIGVRPGRAFIRLTNDTYEIDPRSRTDYDRLLADLRKEGRLPVQIIHAWLAEERETENRSEAATDQDLDLGLFSLLFLSQAIMEVAPTHRCTINVLTRGVWDVSGEESIHPIRAAILGPCQVLSQECGHLETRLIDLGSGSNLSGAHVLRPAADAVLSEILSSEDNRKIALRDRFRWVPKWERLTNLPTQPDSRASGFREKGVYLITGGLGGLGLAIARGLARDYRARLILVGRSLLPPRENWGTAKVDLHIAARTREQIQQLLELEAFGSEVLLVRADVTDLAQVEGVIDQCLRQFGELHGVLHAAGVPGGGLIAFKSREAAQAVLAPKIVGLRNLDLALGRRGICLDLLVLFSSVVACYGVAGQVDYTAANCVLGARADSGSGGHRRVLTIDWGEWTWNAWKERAAALDPEEWEFLHEERRRFGITLEEGFRALQIALASGQRRVLISTRNLAVVKNLQVRRRREHWFSSQPRHQRPSLVTNYASPSGELERQVAGIWEEILAIEGIGRHDNFFEVGGNSLLGIELIARLRSALGRDDLRAHLLYELPTIAAWAMRLSDQDRVAPSEVAVGDRADRRNRTLLAWPNRPLTQNTETE